MIPKKYEAGRAWVRVEDAAACYEVEVAWVREVVAAGLVDSSREQGVERLAASELDRLAEVVRLSRVLGLDLGAIEAWLLGWPH